MKKKLIKYLIFLTSIFGLIKVNAQYCMVPTTNIQIFPTNVAQTTAIYSSGARAFNFNATAGCSYYFATCGLAGGADTYITVHSLANGGTALVNWDDNCGMESAGTWVCTTTGAYSVLLTNIGCSGLAQNTSMTYSSQTLIANCVNAQTIINNSNIVFQGNPGFGLNSGLNISNPTSNPQLGNGSNSLAAANAGCHLSNAPGPKWLILNISNSGNLGFVFGAPSSPFPQAGLYDWSMWLYSANSCTNIFNNTLPPVSCNYNASSSGGTGMGSVPVGGNVGNYQPSIPVLAGQQYLILLSNYSGITTSVTFTSIGSASLTCQTSSIAASSNTICAGSQLTLQVSNSGSVAVAYSWSDGNIISTSNSVVVSPSVSTNYSVSITTSLGCLGAGSVIAVNVNPNPTITVNSFTICAGQTATLNASGASTYSWSNFVIAPSIIISPPSNTTYSVSGTSTAGCVSQAFATTTLIVNTNPMPTIVASSNSICSGNSSTLSFIDASGPSNAMNFDGVNDYLSIATNSNYPIGNSPYTIETWFKTTVNAGNGLIGWGNYGAVNQVNALRTAGNAINNYWWANDLTANASPINILDGNWHHTAATYDGTTRRIYIDGILKASDVPSGHNIPNSNNIRIGSTGGGEYWNGSIDELRVWNINRTQSQIVSNMSVTIPGNSSGLAAYYKFNESSGPTTIDNSGNSNTATLTNGPTWQVPSNVPISSGVAISSYTWSNGSNTSSISISPTLTSNYSVSVTSTAGCIGTSNTTTVNVNPLPVISISGSSAICIGQTATLIANGATTYTWSNASTTSSITVSPASNTSYTVAGTSSAGCLSQTFANINLTVNPSPIITVNNGTICVGQNFTINPNGANTYTIQGGNAVVSPPSNAIFTVAGTSTAGCVSQAVATSSLTVNPNPIITVNSGAICAGQNFTINPNGANTFTIQGGNAVVSPPSNTSYTVIGTNTVTGCRSQAFATSNLTVNPNPIITVNSGTICVGQNFTINPSGANTYTIQGGNAVVSPSINASYSVVGITNAGCLSQAFATSNLTVNPNPTITVNNGTICVGQNFTINPNGANTYTIQGGNAVVSPPNNANYTVIGTNTVTGCVSQAVATSSLIVNPNPIITVNSGAICAGQNFTINPNGANTFTIQGGNAVVSPPSNTGYTVIGTNTVTGCRSQAFATSNLTVNPNPIITVNSGAICVGQNFTINPNGANTYTIQGGNAVVSPTSNASFTVSGTSTAGCLSQAFATSNLTVNPNPTITVNNGTICVGQNFTINPNGANTYTIQGGNALVSPPSNTSFTVIGTNSVTGCRSQAFATSSLIVNPNPIITVNNGTICAGQNFTINPNGANTYTIQGGNAVVSPAGNSSYSVAGTSTAGCVSQAFATSSITVNPLPTVSISTTGGVPTNSSVAICYGSPITFVPSGANTYSWNGQGSWVGFSPTVTTNYIFVGQNTLTGCTSTNAPSQLITVNALPSLTISASNSIICPGYATTLNISGASNYTWYPGGFTIANIIQNPTITTTYSVIGINAISGCTNMAINTVSVYGLPILTASAISASICMNSSTTLSGFGANTYTWYPGGISGNTIQVSPTTQTTYTLIGTNLAGCSNTNTSAQIISVIPLPIVSANVSNSIICFGSSVTLNGSGANTYTWSGNVSNGALFSPTTTLSYTVNGTNTLTGCTSTNSPSQLITVNALPIVSVTPINAFICVGNISTLTAIGAQTYSWFPGNQLGSPLFISPNVTTTYSLVGTNSLGCISTNLAIQTITVNAIPTVSASISNSIICSGQTSTLLAFGANTYTWYPGSISTGSLSIISPTTSNSYSLVGTSLAGCTSTNVLIESIIVNSLPTITINSSSIAVCSGNTLTLLGNGANTYTWSGNVLNNTPFIPMITDTYTVIGTDQNGCDNSAIISITVNTTPTVIATSTSSAVCIGDFTQLTASGASTYTWNPNNFTGINYTVSPINTSTYNLIGISAEGCISSNTAIISITVNPLPIVTANVSNSVICLGQFLTLNGLGANTYSWSSGVFNNVPFTPSASASYTLTGIDANGCFNKFTTITTTVNSLPIINVASSNSVICESESATLTASGAISYTWNTSSNTSSLVLPAKPAAVYVYSVQGTNENGCINLKTYSQFVLECPGIFSVSPISTSLTCSDRGPILGNIKLDENITYQNKEVSYIWKPANLCPTNDCASIENLGAGKYGLTIKLTYTISPLLIRTDSIVFDLIEVKDIDGPCGIKIYNGITPNGDKINDTWKIENIAGYPNNKVMIFSRWGKQLAEINGYNNDDKAWPVGDQIDKLISSTYFYLIDLQGDGKKIEKGWIEVIK